MGIQRHWVSTFLNGDVISPSRQPEVSWEAYLRVTSEVFGSPSTASGPHPRPPLPQVYPTTPHPPYYLTPSPLPADTLVA